MGERFLRRKAAGGILQLHPWGLGNSCAEPPGTWKRFESIDLGRQECQGKGEHGEARAWGRKGHGMGKGIQIGEVSGCKSLALHFTEILGSAGLATPELESHVQSN